MQERRDADEGPLVNFWGLVFYALKWLSISKLMLSAVQAIAKAFGVALPRKWQSPWIDLWVVINLVMSASALYAVTLGALPSSAYFYIFAYSAYRLFEMFIAQINVLLFDAYLHDRRYAAGKERFPYVVRGHRRLVIMLVHNILEITCWYDAALISLQKLGLGQIKDFDGTMAGLPGLVGRTILSFVTFNSDRLAEGGRGAFALIVDAQPFVGMFLVLVLLARFVALLPQPRALAEDDAA